MNERIINLIQSPELITDSDLKLLSDGIKNQPYMQSLRALHLLGISKFDADSYQNELSRTAAYTTDKKILYQFINGKIPAVHVNSDSTSPKGEQVAVDARGTEEEAVLHEALPLQNSNDPVVEEELKNAQESEAEEPTSMIAQSVSDLQEQVIEAGPASDSVSDVIQSEITAKPEEISGQTVDETSSQNIETNFLVEEQIGREEVQPTAVMVEGEANRILFKGEENFMNEGDAPKIDIEMTKEAGKLVTEKPVQSAEQPTADDIEVLENVEKKEEVIKEALQTATGDIETPEANQKSEIEKIAEEGEAANLVRDGAEQLEHVEAEDIQNRKQEEDNQQKPTEDSLNSTENTDRENKSEDSGSGVSYGDVGAFMPEVQIKPASDVHQSASQKPRAAQPELSRHELEMKKLIEEVERKIQEKKANKEKAAAEETAVHNSEINFHENAEDKEAVEENPKASTETVQSKQESSGWKPMNFTQHKPDAEISQKSTAPEETVSEITTDSTEQKVTVSQEAMPVKEEGTVLEKGEVNQLVGNQTAKEETSESAEEPAAEVAKKNDATPESNIPKFINTWQSWLKIDRNTVQFTETATDPEIQTEQQVVEEQIQEVASTGKEQAIEKFIENEPKISQLKEDTQFVVREKKGDISHLMTETLAGIYVEQKLYAKAIRGYQILTEKHPEKKDYYEQKIAEVKELRSGNQFGGNS